MRRETALVTMKRVVRYYPMTSSPGQRTWARVALDTGARRQRNIYEFQLRHFALRFIHSHSDATGILRSVFLGNCCVDDFRQPG